MGGNENDKEGAARNPDIQEHLPSTIEPGIV